MRGSHQNCFVLFFYTRKQCSPGGAELWSQTVINEDLIFTLYKFHESVFQTTVSPDLWFVSHLQWIIWVGFSQKQSGQPALCAQCHGPQHSRWRQSGVSCSSFELTLIQPCQMWNQDKANMSAQLLLHAETKGSFKVQCTAFLRKRSTRSSAASCTLITSQLCFSTCCCIHNAGAHSQSPSSWLQVSRGLLLPL